MQHFLIKWLVTSLAVFCTPYLVSGVYIESFAAAVAAAAVLGIINVLIRPVLIFFTLPLTILSLGLFVLFINAFCFQMVGWFVAGFHVESFGHAFIAALFVSAVSWAADFSIEGRKPKVVVRRGTRTRESAGTVDLHQSEDGIFK